MPLLLLLFLPAIEIFVLIQVGARMGFINTIFALIVIGILGVGLARAQGRYVLSQMQQTLARGEVPASQVLQGLLVFIGGMLFLIPGFVSDVVAIFLVFPGTRHAIAGLVRKSLEKKVQSGQFRVFSAGPFGVGGFGSTGGFRGGFGTGGFNHDGFGASNTDLDFNNEGPRDVTPKVIDITPLSSKSRQKSESDGPKE